MELFLSPLTAELFTTDLVPSRKKLRLVTLAGGRHARLRDAAHRPDHPHLDRGVGTEAASLGAQLGNPAAVQDDRDRLPHLGQQGKAGN